jgi:secreted trypsin-like serine protease
VATRALLAAVLLVLALAPSAVGVEPKATSSIVGGREADIADWPSIAFILTFWDTDGDPDFEEVAQCTGTVIAPEWVISAAHCAFDDNGARTDALLTLTGVGDLDEDGEVIAADGFVVHPDWDPDFLIRDALLIHLESASSAPPHALAHPGVQYSSPPNVPNAAGWGAVDEKAEVGTEVLREAWLQIHDDATCADLETHPSSQTCAGTLDTAGVCRGDSGGPLLAFDGAGEPVLYGLTSYGPQSGLGLSVCSLKAPAVFSWVPAFASFISDTTGLPIPTTTQPGGGTTVIPPRPIPSAPADLTPPRLRRARLGSDVLRIGRRITLSFRLSEAAVVTATILKKKDGRFRRLSPTLPLSADAGTFRRRFGGRLGGRRLKPGRYKIRLRAIDAAGNAARPVTLAFRIVR